MTMDPQNKDLKLALGCICALAHLAQETTASIVSDARWASRERIEDQLRDLLEKTRWTLTAVTQALEPAPDAEDYTLGDVSGEPPPGHPAREFGPPL